MLCPKRFQKFLEKFIMKASIFAVAVACVLAAPVAAYAQQTDAPQTRTEVRADLIQIEQAGYRPGDNDPGYPRKLELAETKVAQEGGDANERADMSMGTSAGSSAVLPSHPVSTSRSASVHAHDVGTRSIYFGQ
jgi:hypothetical protein